MLRSLLTYSFCSQYKFDRSYTPQSRFVLKTIFNISINITFRFELTNSLRQNERVFVAVGTNSSNQAYYLNMCLNIFLFLNVSHAEQTHNVVIQLPTCLSVTGLDLTLSIIAVFACILVVLPRRMYCSRSLYYYLLLL